MGTYLYDRGERPTTVSINIKKMDKAHEALVELANEPYYNSIGWIDRLRKSNDFFEDMKIMGIDLEERNGDGNYFPSFNETYCSMFFDDMIPALKPFVNKGTVFVCNDYGEKISRSFR